MVRNSRPTRSKRSSVRPRPITIGQGRKSIKTVDLNKESKGVPKFKSGVDIEVRRFTGERKPRLIVINGRQYWRKGGIDTKFQTTLNRNKTVQFKGDTYIFGRKE